MLCPNDGTVFFAPDQDPLLGKSIGNYRVQKRLGIGGMGAVYSALETNIEKKVAIKIVHPQLSAHPDLPGLLAEARAANAIGERGCVDIHGFGALPDGRQYLVMELLDGESLETLLEKKGKLSLEEIISIAEPVAASLEAAHAAGFVHRDIKPANIFIIRPARGPLYTKLLDFGLAQRARSQNTIALGTPGYVSPEQAQAGAVGPAADLYSFGCVLYEMATGHLPFEHDDPQQVLDMQSSAPRPHLRESRPDLPEGLDALVFAMMQVDPAARPASTTLVLQALRVLAPKPRPVALWLVAAAIVVVGAGVATALALQPPPIIAPQEDPVEVAVAHAAQGVIPDGGLDGAVGRLLTAEASFPGRREWTALRGELAQQLRRAATEAFDRNELDTAHAFLNELHRIEVSDTLTPLEQQLARAEFARRNGMVRVDDFFVDAYEYPNRSGTLPATQVDWPDAVKLCAQAGKHLCSEDEWQRACRGAASHEFPYGDKLEAGRCLSKKPKVKAPLAAGALEGCVTPEGVHELSGNVAEWTSTAVREGKPQKVIRGGSFAQSDARLSCTARDYFLPGLGGAKHIGFRCCY